MKKISSKLLGTILPVVVAGLLLVVVICSYLSVSAIGTEIGDRMMKTIEASQNDMILDMEKYEVETANIALAIGESLSDTSDVSSYDNMMEQIISNSDLIMAMGYFMEPGYYNGESNFYSYLGEDDGTISKVDLGEYPYTEKDWYLAVQESGEYYYSDPYVDETYGALMISYVEPIYDHAGNFIGVVNTDIDMSSIQNIVDQITVGDTGHAVLIDQNGNYLTNSDSSKVMNVNIADDSDSGFSEVAADILANEQGRTLITSNGTDYRVYYERLSEYGWTLIVTIERSEISQVMDTLIKSSASISILVIIVVGISVFWSAKRISKSIIAVKDMSKEMASGNFSIEPMPVKGKDEIAEMTSALNEMLSANKDEMIQISHNSNTVGDNCETLEQAVRDLEESFCEINQAIQTISSAMMDNSATTEELTASVTEVKESVSNLANKAAESEQMSKEIMDRARKIGHDSTQSFDEAMDLSKQYEKRLQTSIDNSKVVNEIGSMADAISEIAEQINLLSLNASIEAARAGEQGKGFAVVAGEIGNLANQTSDTVTNIQNTVTKVKESVETLTSDSQSLIEFIIQNVTPDYRSFVDTSKKYEDDANSIQELASYLAEIASQLKTTMEDVNLAIQNIAVASQDAAEKSTVILENVDHVSSQVENVGDISEQQREVSNTLDDVVGRYQL